MQSIVTAALLVAGIGAICAVMLIFASKFFAVDENEMIAPIRECLPGANCGACGYAGCDGYAKALAEENDVKPNLCVPGGDSTARHLSELLGVECEAIVKQIAVIHCSGDCNHTDTKMDYVGIPDCKAATMLYGGNGLCSYGCLGMGDCMRVCPQNAICLENGIAHIDARKCIGCGLCVQACPRKLITVVPDTEQVLMLCNNQDKGSIARKKCTNACIGCKKCEKNCPSGGITVIDNLARIDDSKCLHCNVCVQNCPVGCIFLFDVNGLHRSERSMAAIKQ